MRQRATFRHHTCTRAARAEGRLTVGCDRCERLIRLTTPEATTNALDLTAWAVLGAAVTLGTVAYAAIRISGIA